MQQRRSMPQPLAAALSAGVISQPEALALQESVEQMMSGQVPTLPPHLQEPFNRLALFHATTSPTVH